MKLVFTLLFAAFAVLTSCKSGKDAASVPAATTTVPNTPNGAVPEGMTVKIGDATWMADEVVLNQMGVFWMVKGAAADGSVFNIMLPDPLATAEFTVSQGGPVSITYSTSRANGFLFFAPFSENNGWVKTTLADGYLRGTLEVTITNEGVERNCVGSFALRVGE